MCPGRPVRNSHLGNQRKNLPFHTHEFATLEIDTNSVTVRDTKATVKVAFIVCNSNRWTNLAISHLERRIWLSGGRSTYRDERTYKPGSGDGRGGGVPPCGLQPLRRESPAAPAQTAPPAAAPQSQPPGHPVPATHAAPRRSCIDTEMDPPTSLERDTVSHRPRCDTP